MIGVLGKNSYIGNYFISYISNNNNRINCIDCRNDAWKNIDFSLYETLLCPIGIAHVSTDSSMESKYYEVNRDLPVAIAKKAKDEGVEQFIFLSSIIIYGADKTIGNDYIINENTVPGPENFYGRSKLEAERLLIDLEDENFKITILRLPMVYGPGCKGNFPQLLKVAKYSPFCPKINNKRSMIFIENLCEFINQIIENKMYGIYYPQNSEYVSTIEIIRIAAKYFRHKIFFIGIFNPIIKVLSNRLALINKIFGTKVYDFSLSPETEKYNIIEFETSIKKCVESY